MAWETKNKHTLNHDDLVITALAGEGRIGVVDLVRHDEEEFGQEQKQVLTRYGIDMEESWWNIDENTDVSIDLDPDVKVERKRPICMRPSLDEEY